MWLKIEIFLWEQGKEVEKEYFAALQAIENKNIVYHKYTKLKQTKITSIFKNFIFVIWRYYVHFISTYEG